MALANIRTRTRSDTEKLLGRKGYSPTSPGFSSEHLAAAAAKVEGKSERDLALLEFAIHTGKAIAELDRQRLRHPVHELHPLDRLTFLLSLVNFELRSIRGEEQEQLKTMPKGRRGYGAATRRMRGGLRLRSPEALESVIDGFTYVVADSIGQMKALIEPEGGWRDPDSLNSAEMLEYANFCTSYRTLYERWQRVLLLGDHIERRYATWTIRADPSAAKRRGVAEARKYRQAYWEQRLAKRRSDVLNPLGGRVCGVLLPSLSTSEFRLDGQVWRFRATTRLAELAERTGDEAAQIAATMYAWIVEMGEQSIDADGVNCRGLLEAWLVLRELASSFEREGTDREHEAAFWPLLIASEDLCGHLVEALGCTAQRAAAYVKYLTHDGTLSMELYGHPLIPVEEDHFAVFTHGLINADLERVLNRWLKRHLKDPSCEGSKTYARKGDIFEGFARDILKEAIDHAELPGWRMEPNSVRFEANSLRHGREFDLLLSFGSTLIVGEVKCSAHPDDPVELVERDALIEEAVAQVKDEVAWLKANWSEFRSRVSLPLAASHEKHRILPVILVDGCYGPGFPVDDVPVIDGGELKSFIMSGKLTLGVGNTQEDCPRLYSDAVTAEAMLPAFLQQPPIIARYLAEGRRRQLRYDANDADGSRVIYEDWIIGHETPLNRIGKLSREIGGDLLTRARGG